MTIEYKELEQICPEILYIHSQYIEHRYMWLLSRDFIKGDAAVKRKNELYLPMPAGFALKDDVALANTQQSYNQSYNFDRKYNFGLTNRFDDPNYHPNRPYSIYKHGAKTPAILKHTVNGLLGLITKKPMEFIDEESDVYNLTASEVENVNESEANEI